MTNSPLKLTAMIICRAVLPLLLFLCFGSGQADALAVVMPAVVRQNPVITGMGQPSAVAVDRKGRLFVAHPGADRVEVLRQGGKHIQTITELAEPVSIAVAGDSLYIGNKKKGNVEVYDQDFRPRAKLGSGDGEFGEPRGIALDPAGNIYVADRKNHLVKKYKRDGKYMATIGRPGNNDGEFHFPLSVAVDAAAREIVVLDQKEVNNHLFYTSRKIKGARIQFFDLKSGAFKRGYDLYGTVLASDDLMRPVQLAVDGQSRVYVTDASFEEVKVYDHLGGFLGMLDDDAAPLSTPLGLALGATNKLYVVSHNANRLDVFGLDDFTSLLVAPLTASFTLNYGVLEAPAQRMTIANGGTTDLTWTAEAGAEWITLSATGDSLQPTQTATIDVGVQAEGLPIGTYQGTITIATGNGMREVVDVTLRIVPNFNLAVTPNSLVFASDVGVTPLFQALTIENLGTGQLQWQGAVDSDWLVLSGTAGTAPSGVQVFADVSSLAAGTYHGTLVVSVVGETNVGPVPIPVSLTLNEVSPVEPPPEPPLPPPGSGWPGDARMVWKVEYQLPGTSLQSIWGSSGQDIFVVGDNGKILHYDLAGWKSMLSGGGETLYGVWGSSGSDVFAVGENGLILHYDGIDWQRMDSGLPGTLLRSVWRNTDTRVYTAGNDVSILAGPAANPWEIMLHAPAYADLQGIWGSSDADIFAVGEYGTILHYDGAAWTPMSSGTLNSLYGIWGSSASDIFAVGDNGTVLHYEGTNWSQVASGTTAMLKGVWGNGPNEVYVVGANGTMLRYDGAEWFPIQAGTDELLNDVWSGKTCDLYAVSGEGSIIHGYVRKFPWLILQPALDHNIRLLGEQQHVNGAK